jgi:hypothetical protein
MERIESFTAMSHCCNDGDGGVGTLDSDQAEDGAFHHDMPSVSSVGKNRLEVTAKHLASFR